MEMNRNRIIYVPDLQHVERTMSLPANSRWFRKTMLASALLAVGLVAAGSAVAPAEAQYYPYSPYYSPYYPYSSYPYAYYPYGYSSYPYGYSYYPGYAAPAAVGAALGWGWGRGWGWRHGWGRRHPIARHHFRTHH